jgi:hypothetical protein
MKKILILLFGFLLIVSNSNAESFLSALSKAFKNNSELNAERENINISEQELSKRKTNWKKPSLKADIGSLYKYANVVSSASKGCVTDEFN